MLSGHSAITMDATLGSQTVVVAPRGALSLSAGLVPHPASGAAAPFAVSDAPAKRPRVFELLEATRPWTRNSTPGAWLHGEAVVPDGRLTVVGPADARLVALGLLARAGAGVTLEDAVAAEAAAFPLIRAGSFCRRRLFGQLRRLLSLGFFPAFVATDNACLSHHSSVCTGDLAPVVGAGGTLDNAATLAWLVRKAKRGAAQLAAQPALLEGLAADRILDRQLSGASAATFKASTLAGDAEGPKADAHTVDERALLVAAALLAEHLPGEWHTRLAGELGLPAPAERRRRKRKRAEPEAEALPAAQSGRAGGKKAKKTTPAKAKKGVKKAAPPRNNMRLDAFFSKAPAKKKKK